MRCNPLCLRFRPPWGGKQGHSILRACLKIRFSRLSLAEERRKGHNQLVPDFQREMPNVPDVLPLRYSGSGWRMSSFVPGGQFVPLVVSGELNDPGAANPFRLPGTGPRNRNGVLAATGGESRVFGGHGGDIKSWEATRKKIRGRIRKKLDK